MSHDATRRRRAWPLWARFTGLSLGLLLAVQLVGMAVVEGTVQRNARATLQQELDVGERIWARLLEQRAERLRQAAAVLAADFGFRDAVTSGDRPTIVDVLDNHGARISADAAALLDADQRVQALSSATPAAAAARLAEVAPSLAGGGSVVVALAGRPFQFVLVPVPLVDRRAFVMMGFSLGDELVGDLHRIAGLHATLLATGPGPEQIIASSLDAAAAMPAGEQLTRDIGVAGAGSVQLRLSGSLAHTLAPFRALQQTLAALTAVGLLLFALGSLWSARRITRPLQALVGATRQLARGDYAQPLLDTGRRDEVGMLGRAFEDMRGNLQQHEARILRLAYWDRLTDLPNREQFRSRVASACEAGGSLAVLMLDLDRFKHVNHVLGDDFGDRLLVAVAGRLARIIGPPDLLARLGSDEFALLLQPAGPDEAQAAATRIAQAFEQPLMLDDQLVDLSAGIGIACGPQHAADADGLLRKAEVAMQLAKERSAGIQLYDPSHDRGSAHSLSLLSELRHAVERDELRLFLQPKLALGSTQVAAAEALVRWAHPSRGLVPPGEFIPFAEKSGFVRRLTLWIFEAVARRHAALAALGVHCVSVNLSTRDLIDLELPRKLEALRQRHGAPASAFCLEITESAIMDDPQRAHATLDQLAGCGYTLSVDDYGTGYSSLAYLQRLPIGELKIDRSFVMAMGSDAGADTIVRSTIEMAHALGLKVVAEGVEDADTLDRLGGHGCDEAQGYHIARPMPSDQFEQWLTERHAAAPETALTVADITHA